MNIKKQFSHENIINNLAQYEIYYQITLGNLLSITNLKKDINYEIEFQYALGSIYELLKDLETIEDRTISFKDELKKQSAMDAVQFFVNENLDFVKNGNIDIEPIINNINDNIFFNEIMNSVYEENLSSQIQKWEDIITKDLANAIIDSLNELEKQN